MAKKPISKLIAASVILVIILLAAAALNKFSQQQPQEKNAALQSQYATVALFPQNAKLLTIRAEVADTEQKRTTGLMFRKSLGSNEGMLFIFPDAAVRNFWMKNTLIPLDIIFIAENMTILKIHHAVPCKEEPCQLYNSQQPIKYVLEVNNNLTTAYGISKGSNVKVELD